MLSSAMLKSNVPHIDKQDRVKDVTRYLSTKELYLNQIEDG